MIHYMSDIFMKEDESSNKQILDQGFPFKNIRYTGYEVQAENPKSEVEVLTPEGFDTNRFISTSQQYEQPESTYEQPESTYEQPESTYEQPESTYEQPESTYEQPEST